MVSVKNAGLRKSLTTMNEEFSVDEETAIQDALHDPIEVEDDELDNEHYDEPEDEGLDNLDDSPV